MTTVSYSKHNSGKDQAVRLFHEKKKCLYIVALPAFTEVNNRSINVNFNSEVSVACISQMFLLFFFPRLLKKVHTCGLL